MPPPALDPARLPPPESPQRWSFLQELRAGVPPLSDWLTAIESGSVSLQPDLLAALGDHLDAGASLRLLRWWLNDPQRDPALPERIVRDRDPALAALLRQALAVDQPSASAASSPPPELQSVLLPLLGHQRCRADFPLLRSMALQPRPTPVRRAALEGLLLGLGAWPQEPLRETLRLLARDHQPALAAMAVDALARLPGSRLQLARLSLEALDPALQDRLRRRLRDSQASPLLLVVHGRAGGVIPPALESLAAELQQRRGAPVQLCALTAIDPQGDAAALALPPEPGAPVGGSAAPSGSDQPAPPLTLVPLLLLPGQHVRADLAPIAAALRRRGPLRRWPFLGSWPLWQRALAEEAEALAAAAGVAAGVATEPRLHGGAIRPLLLHHPLEGELPRRYLHHLARRCAADCRPSPYSSPVPEALLLALDRPLLPLALAANRLTEALEPLVGATRAAPLLSRPRLRHHLLAQLEALP